MMTLRTLAALLLASTLTLGACAEDDGGGFEPPSNDPALHTYTLIDGDNGYYELYSGPYIASRLANGTPLADDEQVFYTMLRVPAAYVDDVRQDEDGVISFLMEDPQWDVAWEVRHSVASDEPGGPPVAQTRRFQAGQPWLSGITQLIANDDGELSFCYRLTFWAGEGMASQYYGGTLTDDPNMPEPCCLNSPARWKTGGRPEHWDSWEE